MANAQGYLADYLGGLSTNGAGGTESNETAASILRFGPKLYGAKITGLGDSINANAARYSTRTAAGINAWLSKGILAQLIAVSGGRLRPVTGGYPLVPGALVGGLTRLLVVKGGSGYTAATTLTVSGSFGGTGATATPIITNGVITGATLTASGNSYAQSPTVTVTDTGGGSGAVIVGLRNDNGIFGDGGLAAVECELLVDDVIASGANLVFYNPGTNDQTRGYTLQETKDSMVRSLRRLLAGGVTPIVLAPLSRDGSNGSNPKRVIATLGRWIMTTLPGLVPGIIPVDVNAYITNPGAATVDNLLTGYSTDGLHPTPLGAYNIAKLIWAQIKYLFPLVAPKTFVSHTWDQYDATYMPDGNLLANPCLSQGTPVAAETPFTGNRMSGLVLSRSGGAGTGTTASSVDVRSDARTGYRQVLTVSVTGETAGAIYTCRFSASSTATALSVQGGNTLQVGDTIQAMLDELELSNVSGLRGVKFYMSAYNSATLSGATLLNVAGFLYDEDTANYPQYADTLFMPTREMVIPSNTLGIDCQLDFVCNAGAVSFTAKLAGAALRRLN